jgi:2-polyprenyl-3-methyl-5-hydroxy-6-metoxy-1,4-benzoquinol methylase
MQKLNYQEVTWDLVWKNDQEKSSYSLNEWRDERADDKVGYFIQSGLMFKPGERVLDAGCGDGSILFALKKHFDISLVGADFSEEALTNAAKNSIRKGLTLESYKADTRDLPFENNSIDKIFSLGVVEHLPNPEKAVAELARCLSPDGVLILMTPNKFSFGRIDRLIKSFLGIWKFGHQDEFSTEELAAMILQSGLIIQKTEVVKRKRFKNDSAAFKLIYIFDSLLGAFNSHWGFYSYVYATKNGQGKGI